MEITRRKLIGSFLIATLIATVGVVIVSAQEDTPDEAEGYSKSLWCERPMFGQPPFFSELTEEQQNEINQLREEMKSEGSTPEEIRDAIQEKLESYGIEFPNLNESLDERLDNEIQKAEERLEILYRTKELRNEEKTWEEINETIQEEYGLGSPLGDCHQGSMFRNGFRGEPGLKPFEFNDQMTEEPEE
jgi:hypothetical protein